MKKKIVAAIIIMLLCLQAFSLSAMAADAAITVTADKMAQTVTVTGTDLAPSTFVSLRGYVIDGLDATETMDYIWQLQTDAQGGFTFTYPSNGFYGGDSVKVFVGGGGLAEPLAQEIVVAKDPRVRVQEDDAALSFSDGWTDRVQIGKFEGHIARSNTKRGASMSFTYVGDSFKIVSYQSYSQGIVDIYVDGEKFDTVDLYAATPNGIFKYDTGENRLSYGQHTVSLVIAGKNAKSVGYGVYVDAVEIYGSFVTGSGEEALVDDQFMITTAKAADLDVLANDAVVAGAVPTVVAESGPASGDVVWDADKGVFVFTPTALFNGTDSFTYEVDGEQAEVTLSYIDGIRYEETFSGVAFDNADDAAAKWSNYRLAAYSGGGAQRSSQRNDTVTVRFYGTGIELIGYQSWSRGNFAVTLTDAEENVVESIAKVDSFDRSYDKLYQDVVYETAANLEPGWYTLTVTVLGAREPLALGNAVDIDAFVVLK